MYEKIIAKNTQWTTRTVNDSEAAKIAALLGTSNKKQHRMNWKHLIWPSISTMPMIGDCEMRQLLYIMLINKMYYEWAVNGNGKVTVQSGTYNVKNGKVAR